MKIVTLYAELQSNPRNLKAYRSLAEHYKNCNMENEHQAFLNLIDRKFNDHSTNPDEEQRPDNSEDS
jgi:hypothetical protein